MEKHHRKIGIFAGTFDPLTKGHLNLIERSSRLFDEVIIVVAVNTSKKTLFTPEERQALIQANIQDLSNVRIDFARDGLIADFYREVGATALIRGLRNATDFDYEHSIASANAKQVADLETVTLFADDRYRYLSSSLIKEIAFFKGNVDAMVPKNVATAMQEKYHPSN